MPHCRRRDRGTITIESALIFPVLVAVLFVIIDGGRLMGSRVMLSQATISAARVACLSSTTSNADLDQAVRDAAPMLSGISVSAIGCTSPTPPPPVPVGSCTGWPKQTGDQVTVTATYTFNPGFFRGLAKILSQQTRVVCE
jgi:Flp pilus assembly protein TadG